MSLEPVPPPTMWSRFGKTGAAIGIVLLAGFLVVGGASYLGDRVGNAFGSNSNGGPGAAVDVPPGVEIEIEIPPGSSAQDIGAILAAQGIVESANDFEIVVRTEGAASALQAGVYELETGMAPTDVVTALRAGPLSNSQRVTIREGLRVSEIVARLAEVTLIDEAEFTAALLDGSVTTGLRDMPDEPTLTDWEGLLFPDTYDFTRNADAGDILQRMASTMEQRMAGIDWSEVEAAGYSPYEGLVIASLIEAEVRVPAERPIVSSVIENRLRDGMLLQIDATVLYALNTRLPQNFDNTVDSPYNTYQEAGLPPTPINAPGLAAIEAAAAPDDTEFLFYVLSASDGSHTFTTNLDDHNAAVQQAREDGVLP